MECANNFLVSNLAKYIPGKIFQYTSRVYLFSKLGIPKKQTTAYMLLEVIYLLTSGVMVFTIAYYLQPLNLQLHFRDNFIAIFILLLMVVIIIVHPKILSNMLNLAGKILKLEFSLKISVSIFQSLILIFNYVIFWIFSGVSLAFFAGSFFL